MSDALAPSSIFVANATAGSDAAGVVEHAMGRLRAGAVVTELAAQLDACPSVTV